VTKTEAATRAPGILDTADIRLIRLFMRVVEAGGLSAAQADLNLSLSSISEKIGALEERLGLTLCRRGRSGFALTDNGRAVYEEGQRLLASLEQFSRRVAGLRSELAGTLTVGIVDNTITDPRSPVAAAVRDLVARAPQVHLTLETRPPGELLRDTVSGKLDLAIGSFPRTSLGLDYVDLHEELHHFYCGAGHPLFGVEDAAIDIERVRGHRIIARTYWAARDIKIFEIAAPHATVSNMEAEAHLILSGAYLGYLPEHFAGQFVTASRMRKIRPSLFSYKAKFHIAAPQDWQARPLSRAFIQTLRDHALNGDRRT